MPPETDSTPPMQISQGSAAATFKTTYPIPVVHWPKSRQEAVEAQLVEHLADGSTTLKCREVINPYRPFVEAILVLSTTPNELV